MKPEEVKLSMFETVKVAIKTLDDIVPWKGIILYLLACYINVFVLLPLSNPDERYIVIDRIAHCTIVVAVELFILCCVFALIDLVYTSFKKKFNEHKTVVQKKILDSVDERILK